MITKKQTLIKLLKDKKLVDNSEVKLSDQMKFLNDFDQEKWNKEVDEMLKGREVWR